MILTLTFGLWGLSRQHSLWRDEAATWQVALRSIPDIWHMLGQVDAVHGLYYAFMHGLFELFGPSTTTLRLPSVLAIAVASACITTIGHRIAGASAGLGAGLAVATLPAMQFYLQEGRPYALVTAGAGISTLLLLSMLEGRGRGIYWVGYGGTILICGFLNWLSLLILLAHLATLAWVQAGRAVWLRWTITSTVAVTLTLPLILFSRGQSAQVSWIPPLTWHMMIGPGVLLGIGCLGALLDRPQVGRISTTAVGLPLLVVPQACLITLSFVQPLYLDRYILFSMLGLALLIGTGLSVAAEKMRHRFPKASVWFVPAVAALTVAALLPQTLTKRSPASRVDDVFAIAAHVRQLKQNGDAVLFIPAARRDTKLVSPDAFSGLHDIALTETPEKSGTLKGVEADPAELRTAMLSQRRILLVTDAAAVARPASAKRDTAKSSILEKYFTVIADEQDRGRRVTVYARLGETSPSSREHKDGQGHAVLLTLSSPQH